MHNLKISTFPMEALRVGLLLDRAVLPSVQKRRFGVTEGIKKLERSILRGPTELYGASSFGFEIFCSFPDLKIHDC